MIKLLNSLKGNSYYISYYRFAYIEFQNKEGAQKAKHLNESLFKGRQITVAAKRKNVHGRGRGGARGKNMMTQAMSVFAAMMMGKGRGGWRGPRGGGRGGFNSRAC